MSLTLRSCLLTLGLVASWAARAQQVDVQFPAEHRYVDAGETAEQVALTEQRLTEALQRLAARHLAPGDRLSVEFREIDLAGEPRRGATLNAPRVLRGSTDVPRLSFAFRIDGDRSGARTGEEDLKGLGYLQGWRPVVASGPLPFEERLLAQWFRTQFAR